MLSHTLTYLDIVKKGKDKKNTEAQLCYIDY